MSFSDMIKKSVLEGFSYADITTTKIVVTLLITYIIAMYIHLVYKFSTKNAFYYKNYGISMTIISVVTASIILAMQSSLVISLGMVGALSIVRFRTAIKDPLDLLFLFWSIGTGIVCGASLYGLAIITAVVVTLGIMLFVALPISEGSVLLVINTNSRDCFELALDILKKETLGYKLKSKNIHKNGMDMIVEVKLRRNDCVMDQLYLLDAVQSVTMLENNVDVKS